MKLHVVSGCAVQYQGGRKEEPSIQNLQVAIERFHSRGQTMQIYWDKRKHLRKKRFRLPEDFPGTPSWPPFIVLEHQYGRCDVM